MGQTILYPFSILQDNKLSYLKTLKHAEKEQAKVICFTSVLEEQNFDKAYLHLLSLYGYYQSEVNNWANTHISIEPTVRLGEIETELAKYLKGESVDAIICQSQTGFLGSFFFNQLVKGQKQPPDILRFEKLA